MREASQTEVQGEADALLGWRHRRLFTTDRLQGTSKVRAGLPRAIDQLDLINTHRIPHPTSWHGTVPKMHHMSAHKAKLDNSYFSFKNLYIFFHSAQMQMAEPVMPIKTCGLKN